MGITYVCGVIPGLLTLNSSLYVVVVFCLTTCLYSGGMFKFRFVSFRFISFRFVSFRFVSFRFVSFRFVSFRFWFLGFLVYKHPLVCVRLLPYRPLFCIP